MAAPVEPARGCSAISRQRLEGGPMTREVRRVVTTHDAAGRAVVMVDGAAPNVKVRPIGGFVSTLLWVLDGVPARHSGDKDFADVTIGTAPPQGGAVFRIV